MSAFWGFLGTIVGASIAGYFMKSHESSRQEYEKRKNKKELLLSKYESIYRSLTKYSRLYNELSMQILKETGFGGKFEAKELTTSIKDDELKMNILFYAPELVEIYQEISEIEERALRMLTEFIMKSDNTKEEKEKLTGDFVVEATKLGVVLKKAQDKLKSLVTVQMAT